MIKKSTLLSTLNLNPVVKNLEVLISGLGKNFVMFGPQFSSTSHFIWPF